MENLLSRRENRLSRHDNILSRRDNSFTLYAEIKLIKRRQNKAS